MIRLYGAQVSMEAGRCRDAARRVSTMLPIKFVIFPFCYVVFDIICDIVHVFVATNDVVVETGLPCEGEVLLVGEFRNRRF